MTQQRQPQQPTQEDQAGLYIISVAARLLSMHPQTLRKYERAGFLSPNRTDGMLRLYSADDMARLQLIKHFVETMGLNLAGVETCLELANIVGHLAHDIEKIEDPVEFKKQVHARMREAVKALQLDKLKPTAPAQSTIRIEFQ
ncbi:MAG: putative heat shock protein HspR [Nitrospira sp.]|nr:putative heat shock protein HspR [Nitrospira sp.]